MSISIGTIYCGVKGRTQQHALKMRDRLKGRQTKSVGLIIWLMAIWKIKILFLCESFSFILSCENRMQNGHLLIIRHYFYLTGRNESIVGKLCVFPPVNNRKTFWKGFLYLLHKKVEPVLRLLWVLRKPQASRSILVSTHFMLWRDLRNPGTRVSPFKRNWLILFFIYLTCHHWENL